ncbi:DUF2156 domain-containing protein [Faecalimonas sp.]
MKNIEFRRPEMEDRKLLDGYFKRYPSRSCERTFINTYLWSRHYKVKYAVIENTLVFKNEDHEIAFTYPIGEIEDIKNALKFLMEYCEKENKIFELYCVTEEQFKQLNEWYPNEFQITYDRDIADYVYESEKLITLSGKKLHGKRNHINKFKAEHQNWKYETMTENNVEECFQMALKWRKESGCDADVEKNAEMCVALNSLRLFKELEMIGGILRVDGEVVAFTMGEPVSEDTFVVHIEKAFAGIQGAYPMINQQFIEHECSGYKYINREDDAGVEGLRKAKLSYRPAFLIGKGRVKR